MSPKINYLKELINLVKDYNVNELEVPYFFGKIKIKRNVVGLRSDLEGIIEKQKSLEQIPLKEDKYHINSPMVGTFYRASAPNKPPYVEVGRRVKENDVVCVIETMKIMNEIKAGCNGRVEEILVENAKPVQYGQPLFKISKTEK